MPASATPLELAFSETMRGFVTKGFAPPSDYPTAAEAGRKAGTRAEFTLTIAVADLDRFLAEKRHAASARGTVRVDGFTAAEGAPVTGGVFEFFIEPTEPPVFRMRYVLPFFGLGGKPYLLEGFKEVRTGLWRVLGATTTLFTAIREGHDQGGALLATGMLKIRFADVMRQLASFAVSGTESPVAKAWALIRFDWTFVASLWDAARPRWRRASRQAPTV